MSPILGIWSSAGRLLPQYNSIATVNGDGTSNSIVFNNIPSGYTHLQVRGIIRGIRSFTTEQVYVRFNSDSGNNYSYHSMYGAGNNPISVSAGSTQNVWFCGEMPAASSAANSYMALVIDVLDYANTNKFKTGRSMSGWHGNSSTDGTGFKNVWFSGGNWRNTNAINTLTIVSNGGLTTASTFALYGIKGR